ncbi:MAG: FAD-binding protein [Planctomycetes bacterium]|nr:FAD-binding protein [Planctomycetota bacterium]
MTSSKSWPCAALPNAELGAKTTMHVGGAAQWLLEPATPEELREAIAAARELGFVPRILGGGANLIVADGVLPGVVITTDRMKRIFRPSQGHGGSETLREDLLPTHALAPTSREEGLELVAWSGVTLLALLRSAQKLGWSGVEALAGVPGQVGGGIAMNAGGKHGEMWDVVERLLVVDEQGNFVELPRAECNPSYRNANLGGLVVASALLKFKLSTAHAVGDSIRDYLAAKNRVQPVTEWSAGCVWKNPDPERSAGRSAGMLVEQCGAKGRVRGDAQVSLKHGNFVVNRGNATAQDVLGLIAEVEDIVAHKSGIALEREVKIWGA